MPYTTPQLIIQVCYGIVLFPLYIFVMIQFLVPSLNKPFKSFFFKLCIIIGFVDILHYINAWFFTKLTACPLTYRFYLGKEDLYLFKICSFLSQYLVPLRCYLLVFSSANRLTALAIPPKHEKIWKKFGKFAIFLSFFIPFPLIGSNLFGTTKIYITNEAVSIDVKADFVQYSRTQTTTAQYVITALSTTILNLGALYYLIKYNSSKTNDNNSVAQKAEKRLLFVTLLDLFFDILFTIVKSIQIYRTIVGYTTTDDTPYLASIWMLDIINLSRPITLILICTSMKKAFFKFAHISYKDENTVIIQSNNNSGGGRK